MATDPTREGVAASGHDVEPDVTISMAVGPSVTNLCANCGMRPGTIRWGATLAVTHGFVVMWCEVCALTKQIEHAEERAALLPGMRARLKEITQGSRKC